MELSIVIVSYNVKSLLQKAIDSLMIATQEIETEFFVVDNHSQDGSAEMVKSQFPFIQLICNEKNLGFSVANNQALKKVSGNYTLIINPDTITQPNTIVKALNFIKSKQDVGCLGVRMVDAKGNYLPESKRGLPTPWVSFFKLSGLYKFFPYSSKFNAYYLGNIGEFEIAEVDVLTGAFMLIKTSALNKVGLFDEDFFMYGEDIDLCYRLKLAGYKNYYYPEVSITHYKGQSTKKYNLNYMKSFYGSMFIFVKKHFLKF